MSGRGIKSDNTYSKNAIAIYKRLYFDKLKGETKPSETHDRIASFIGDNDDEKVMFFELLQSKIFRPNSPCMINAGCDSKNPHDRALSACYVLGLEDSMDSIIEMWGVCARIYASGAGSGIPITNLREKGALISTGGNASGPLAYLNVVDMLSNTVRSGGKTRRAANMGIFRHNHPDVIEIIDSKLNGSIQTFNLSMSVTDEFMGNITDGKEVTIDLVTPNGKQKIGKVSNKLIWDKVIKNAWTNGDPGLFFFDTVNQFNPFPSLGPIDCTNPCGEVPLPPWSVCNIGSINLRHFVRTHPGMADPNFKPYFQWDEFKKRIPQCMLFLDKVIDKQDYIHERFMKNARDWRPVGLGIMGLADALIALEIPYDSDKAIEFFNQVCFTLNYECIKKSIEMAANGEWAVPVPGEDGEHFYNLLKFYTKYDHVLLDMYDEHGIHNSNWTMIAPTGSTSMSADCSYAWEPLMALVWEKPLVESNEVLKIVDPQFEKDLNDLLKIDQYNGPKNKETIINDIIQNKGSIQNISYLPEAFKQIYKVAHDIDPRRKIMLQGAGQSYISMAISSTTNLPNDATIEDIESIYTLAHEFGLKGITVYRDGCRDKQIVHFGEQKIEKKKILKQRPIKRSGSTVEIKTPHGKFFVTVNFVDGKPIEMFFSIGKQGGLVNVIIDALARICSKGLQAGMDMEWIIETLEGLKGETFWFKIDDNEEKSRQADSIVDALSKILFYHFMPDEDRTILSVGDDDCEIEEPFKRCPECQKMGLRYDAGCRGGVCMICGYTTCS